MTDAGFTLSVADLLELMGRRPDRRWWIAEGGQWCPVASVGAVCVMPGGPMPHRRVELRFERPAPDEWRTLFADVALSHEVKVRRTVRAAASEVAA